MMTHFVCHYDSCACLFSAVVMFFHGFASSSFIFIGLTAAGFSAAGECGGFTTFDNKKERCCIIDVFLCYFLAVSYNCRSFCVAVAGCHGLVK